MQPTPTRTIIRSLLVVFMTFGYLCLAYSSDQNQLDQIEKLIRLQSVSESLGDEITASLKKGKTLSGGQINRLSQVIDRYHQLLTPMILEAREKPLSRGLTTYDTEELNTLMLHTEITRQMFSLLKTYFQNHDLRRLVTELLRYHPSENNIVKESFEKAKFFLSKSAIDSLIKQLKVLQIEIEENGIERFNEDETQIISVIVRDNLTSLLQRGPKLPRQGQIFLDSTASLINTLTEYGSWIVGNTAGSIHWRKGHLLKHPEIITKIKNQLQPFDIIVEKAPFILTDYMIPGHFGHAALYLGNEQQLRSLGLWEHPALINYQGQIKKGLNIIEAVRSGVRLTSIDQFINVDELAILRLKKMERPQQMLSVALKQMFKEYDFNFDVRNPLTVVCSELIYLTMGHISWPTETVLGRPTVSPDHLVELAFYRQSPLEFVGHWSADAKKVFQHNKSDLAGRVSFVPVDKSISNSEEMIFDRRVQYCEKKINPRIRVNSTRSGRLETAVCNTEYVTNVYQEENMEHVDFKKLVRSLAR